MADEKDPQAGTLIVQGKNGGMLRKGGVSHVGGQGFLTKKLRDRSARSFAKRIKILNQIADGWVQWKVQDVCPHCGWKEDPKKRRLEKSEVDVKARLQAIDMLGKYGVGGVKTVAPPPEGSPADETREAAFDALETSTKIITLLERAMERRQALTGGDGDGDDRTSTPTT